MQDAQRAEEKANELEQRLILICLGAHARLSILNEYVEKIERLIEESRAEAF